MNAERTLPNVVNTALPTHCAALVLERADTERRYFTGKVNALQIIRGGNPDIADEEIEAGASAEAWTLIAETYRTALYGDPSLADGDHFAGMEKRAPGLHGLRVVGERLDPPAHAAHLHFAQDVPSAPPYIAGCPRCDFEFVRTFGEFSRSGA